MGFFDNNLSISSKKKLNCFRSCNRLSNKHAISAVFESSICKVSSDVGLILCKPNGLPYSRLVIIVGKKALKKAVCRNKAKRHIRETFRHSILNIGFNNQQNNLVQADFVFLVRKGFSLQTELQEELNRLWKSTKGKVQAYQKRHTQVEQVFE